MAALLLWRTKRTRQRLEEEAWRALLEKASLCSTLSAVHIKEQEVASFKGYYQV